MGVRAFCEKCRTWRDRCQLQSVHKRYTAWEAGWNSSRLSGTRLRAMFGSDLENPKQLAEDQVSAWKTDRKRGVLGFSKAAPTLFGPLADKYWIEHALVEGRKPKESAIYVVEMWKEWLGLDRKVSPLSEAELDAFKNSLRELQRKLRIPNEKGIALSGSTVNRYFNIGRAICEKGREWGMVKANPFEHIADVKEEQPVPRFLEEPEIDKLFGTINVLMSEYGKPVTADRKQRLLEFMTVLYHTGARPSSIEECSFDNGDADLTNRVIWFTTYKGGRHQKKHRYPVPMDDEVFAIVSRRAEETRKRGLVFDCGDIYKLTRLVVAQSGVNEGKPEHMHFSIYGLKHCLASRMIMNGASEAVVAELFGHTDTRMVHQHYKHLTMAYLRKVQGKADFKQADLKVV